MRALYTIGHSNHELAALLKALRQHEVEIVADVRSIPRSRWVPHFSQPAFQHSLQKAGIGYIFLGNELGGRPDDPKAYRPDGLVDYRARRKSPEFRAGLDRVLCELKSRSLAIMCAEEDPLDCHRFLMITPELVVAGVEVQHIRRRGEIESQSEAENRLLAAVKLDGEGSGSLFAKNRDALLEQAYGSRAEQAGFRKKPAAKKKSRAAQR